MKKIKGAFSFFYKCFAFYTLVVYALLIWIPFNGWISGFMMMTFPAVIIGQFACLIVSLLTTRKNVFLPLILVLLGGIFLPRTYSLGFNKKNDVHLDKRPFKVMSYNVHVFRHNSDNREEKAKMEIRNMKEFIATSGADILCLPEYFNRDKSKLFNTSKILRANGYKYAAYLNKSEINKPDDYWGLAIFSKLPIVAMKDTIFMAQNGIVSADIKIGKDTVRVIALHLYSMTLKLEALGSQRTFEGILSQGKSTARLIKKGFTNHADEMDILESWIKASPYPVIVCGDFNETPYSYVYGKAKSLLNNSFEEKGNGFGFSFNNLPYFIRIDHHFYDKEKINLIDFKTIDSVKYSDHYPLLGTYQIASRKDNR